MSKFPAEKRGRGYQQNAKEKKEAHDANAMRYPIWQASLFAISSHRLGEDHYFFSNVTFNLNHNYGRRKKLHQLFV